MAASSSSSHVVGGAATPACSSRSLLTNSARAEAMSGSAVRGAVDLGVRDERLLEVAEGVGRDDLFGRVEQFVGREAGERAAVVDVGCLTALDLRGDDATRGCPTTAPRASTSMSGFSSSKPVDHVFPEALGVVGVAGDEQVERWSSRRRHRRRCRRRSRTMRASARPWRRARPPRRGAETSSWMLPHSGGWVHRHEGASRDGACVRIHALRIVPSDVS